MSLRIDTFASEMVIYYYFLFVVSEQLCLSSSSALHFFPLFFFGSTALLTGMAGISLHRQWPLTSQLHGSVSQREQLDFFSLRIKLHAQRLFLFICWKKQTLIFAAQKVFAESFFSSPPSFGRKYFGRNFIFALLGTFNFNHWPKVPVCTYFKTAVKKYCLFLVFHVFMYSVLLFLFKFIFRYAYYDNGHLT
jgi:hypothetical protein